MSVMGGKFGICTRVLDSFERFFTYSEGLDIYSEIKTDNCDLDLISTETPEVQWQETI